jgi:hypothetical protein
LSGEIRPQTRRQRKFDQQRPPATGSLPFATVLREERPIAIG